MRKWFWNWLTSPQGVIVATGVFWGLVLLCLAWWLYGE
jgi:hypothetical protein